MTTRPVLAVLVLLVVAACGAPAAAPPAPASQGVGAFPVTITHRFGVATIPAPPQRVVAIGDEDIAVALGVTPVGIVRTATASGLAPHQEGVIDPARVTFLDVPTGGEGEGTGGADIEQIAALRPDLILAVNDFTLEQDYPELSRIAPTVGYATAWGEQSWQEQAVVVATALGLADRGRQVVADTEARIRAVRDANPGLVGRSVTFSFAFGPDQIVTLKTDRDPTVKLFTELGMRIPPGVAALPAIAPGNPGGALSFENISLLDADIVVMLYATPELRRQIEEFALFRNLRGVRDGRYVVVDLPTATALRSPTVLSIPWALEQLGPSLARVAR